MSGTHVRRSSAVQAAFGWTPDVREEAERPQLPDRLAAKGGTIASRPNRETTLENRGSTMAAAASVDDHPVRLLANDRVRLWPSGVKVTSTSVRKSAS
jgi:hypothetical protein